MNLYLINVRPDEPIDHMENVGMLIVAHDVAEARKLAFEAADREDGARWTDTTRSTLRNIGTAASTLKVAKVLMQDNTGD